jgi:hypothetical protein
MRHTAASTLFVLTIAAIIVCGDCVTGSAKTIEQNVAESAVILIARLSEIHTSSLPSPGTTQPGRRGVGFAGGALPQRQSHTCVWSVILPLKGAAPQTVEFPVPSINQSLNYGDPKFRVTVDRDYLLFLSRRSEGGPLLPNDPAVPMILLGKDAPAKATTMPSTAPSGRRTSETARVVESLLLASLDDPECRAADLYLLHSLRSDAVVTAARGALQDSDPNVKVNALCCLASNQVVEAIPQIAEMVHAFGEHAPATTRLLNALVYYDTPLATPHLNPLLVDEVSPSLQQFAAMAMNQKRLADKTSVPFLIRLLKETDGLGSYYAYIMLHKLYPTTGPNKDRLYFEAHREEELKAIESAVKQIPLNHN